MWPVPGKWTRAPFSATTPSTKREIAGDAAEVIENAAGDEDHGDIAPPRIRDRTEHGCDPGGRRA